jgi:regulator of replication initiation timing
MRTLQEHFDDLDRMVDSGTNVAKTRNQISFIWGEVAALQANYSALAEAHLKLQEENSKLKEAAAKSNDRAWDELRKEAEEERKLFASHQLKH